MATPLNFFLFAKIDKYSKKQYDLRYKISSLTNFPLSSPLGPFWPVQHHMSTNQRWSDLVQSSSHLNRQCFKPQNISYRKWFTRVYSHWANQHFNTCNHTWPTLLLNKPINYVMLYFNQTYKYYITKARNNRSLPWLKIKSLT